jgi:hypothetical protein
MPWGRKKSSIYPIVPTGKLSLIRAMKKIFLIVLVLGAFARGHAQVTVRKDVTAYFSQLPTPPATTADSYKNCRCLNASGTVQGNSPGVAAAVHDSILSNAKQMGTLTATENQQLQQAKVTANQANADHVNTMNKDQQLTWAQNNMQGYGNTAQAAALAQKLQDPAEVAKFKAMTPAQKMAYLQANGIDPMKAAAPAAPTNIAVADAQTKQQRMQQDLNNYQAGQYTGTLEALLNGSQPASAADAQQKLLGMGSAYNGLLAFYKRTDSAFASALIAANYGYTGGADQDKNVSGFSAGQVLIMEQVGQLETYLNRIYQYGAQAAKSPGGH